jgi:hypothetical protein
MDTENDLPYPVLAVTDLANDYSPEHFRFAVGHCRDVIAKVTAEDNRSDQQIARVRILKFLDLQLSRAVRWVEDDADLMAGVMRNLSKHQCVLLLMENDEAKEYRQLKGYPCQRGRRVGEQIGLQ